ncbi:MAG: hypothetical protein ACK4RK_02595 [Gemmataceae bacterium]
MIDPREQLWSQMQAVAERVLSHPKDLEPREPFRWYGSLLRLWHRPSYGPLTSWTIGVLTRSHDSGETPLVREVSWDRDADHQRIFQAMAKPSDRLQLALRVRDAELPEPELSRLLTAGQQLAVPLLVFSRQVGLEGDYWGLETYESSPYVQAQWWGDGPLEWRHFLDWVTQLRQFLLGCLAEK